MAKYKDIESYKRVSRLKKFFKRLIWLAVIAAGLFIVINLLSIYNVIDLDKIINSREDEETVVERFPLVIKNEPLLNCVGTDTGIAVLSKSNLFFYTQSGKREETYRHGYTNPVIKKSGKYILTYDCGGTKFRVDTVNKSIGEIKLTEKIITAELAPNGNIGVVTNGDRYASVFTVFNQNMSGDYSYKYSATEQITSVSFSDDSHFATASAIVQNGGMLSSNVYMLDLNKETNNPPTLISRVVPLATEYQNSDYVTVVGKNEVASLESKTGKLNKYSYNGSLLCFDNIRGFGTVIVSKSPYNKYCAVILVDVAGNFVKQYNLTDEIIDVESDGARISVLGKNSYYNFDMELNLLDTVKLEKSFGRVALSPNKAYLMNSDRIEKQQIK